VHDIITAATTTPTVTVSFATSPIPYDGNAHGATATVTGVGGVDISSHGTLPITYTPGGSSAPVNAGSYTASAHFASNDPSYTDADSTTPASLTITKIDATIEVTGYSGPYTATPHGATGTATGLLGADLNSLLHVATTTYTDVPGGSVHWTFDGNTNYNSGSGNATVTITKVDATIDVTGYSGPYTATAHGATGTATGVLGAGLNSLLPVTTTTYSKVHGGSAHWTSDGNATDNTAHGSATVAVTNID